MTANAGVLVLERRASRLIVLSHLGAAVREFRWRDQDVLRPAPPGASDDPFTMACFPMVPFVNRIAHGRFRFAGRSVQLERNWSEDPHPLHGQGWRASWDVTATTPTSATLRFEGGGDDWPWRYACEQRFRLSVDELSVELSLENLSDSPMPSMLGLHPYFPHAAQARLHAQLPRVWRTNGSALPVQEIDTPRAWRFDPPRAVGAVPLDHCFCGWNGHAVLEWPERIVTVRAPGCAFLHVYAPQGRDFFCIEPQNGAPGALVRNADEASVLAPGARIGIEVRFELAAR
jgi:aldose 1-epimerase